MKPLPIDPHLEQIVKAVDERGVAILIAPPGTGKTTRVPPALARQASPRRRVLLLQPRRVAAVAAAARMAEELSCKIGERVGYQVRFDRKIGPQTVIEVVTEGILLRRLQEDPFLEGIGCILLDEFHERSLSSDLALAMLLEIRDTVREDLQIVVMSATLDPKPVSEFLHGAPVLEVAAPRFEVTIEYAERMSRSPIEDRCVAAVQRSLPRSEVHSLVFLPGMREIRRVQERLSSSLDDEVFQVMILHGSLDLSQQRKVLDASKLRKIILATNVAETSITIDGVDLVVDAGLERRLCLDRSTGLERLETVRISEASADQRAGRAGRTSAGLAIRLWTPSEQRSLEQHRPAEIERLDLGALVLQLLAWGIQDPSHFAMLTSPPPQALQSARALLEDLQAVDDQGRLTEVGKQMSLLPLQPRLARLYLEALRSGDAREGALLACMLEQPDFLDAHAQTPTSGPSDLLWRLDLIQQWQQDRRQGSARGVALRTGVARAVQQAAQDLLRRTRALAVKACVSTPPDSREDRLLRHILLAFPDRVVRRRENSTRGKMVSGRGVALARTSCVQEHDYFVAVSLDDSNRRTHRDSLVLWASAIEYEWLASLFPARVNHEEEVFWDAARAKVRCVRVTLYRDLPLQQPVESACSDEQAAAILLPQLTQVMDRLLSPSAKALCQRMRFVQGEVPHLALPQWSAVEVAEQICSHYPHLRSLREVEKLDHRGLLEGTLTYAQRKELDRLAPESLQIPNGRKVPLEYSPDKPPQMSLRVQELFGIQETPTVAGGRVPVLLNILGPNYRPVQVTRDLESFWNSTYHLVRKDLRGRYPKHAWPEDPRTAPPQRRKGR